MTTEDLANVDGAQSTTTATTAATEQSEKVETTAKDDQTSEATTETGDKSVAATTEDAEAKAASEAGKALNERKQRAKERVQEAVGRQREAERRAQKAEFELAELRKSMKAPVADEYTDPQKLNADHLDYTMDQREARRLEKEKAEASKEAGEAIGAAWRERKEAYVAENPDVDFNKHLADTRISDVTSMMIADMEEGPAVFVQLAKNAAELRRIEGLPERQRPFALGKIAAQVTAPPPRRVTSAPPPVDAASGKSGGGPNDPAKMSQDDYVRWRKSGGGGRR
jgi:hypothetical protein